MICVSLKKKLAKYFSAALLGVSATLAIIPTPVVDASILESVLGIGAQYVVLDKQLSYLNGDGRDELSQSLQEEHGVNEDPELNAQLDRIMFNLTNGIAQIDPTINEKPYNYFINNDHTFNAFCSLGHNLSVNTGIFELISDESEIAVVIAHELAHGQKNHPMKGFRHSIPVVLGTAVLQEATGGLGGAVLGVVVHNQLTAKSITKPMEWDADNLAFDYIVKTNYNPGACAAIWQRVTEKMNSQGREDFVGEIFSPDDHPTNEQRRDSYAKKLSELSKEHVTVYEGTVTINGKNFLVCANDLENDISGAERGYLVAGNIARLYENTASPVGKGKSKKEKKNKKKDKNEYLSDSPNVDIQGQGMPKKAYAEDGMLFIDGVYILTELDGEPSAEELAEIFNLIK